MLKRKISIIIILVLILFAYSNILVQAEGSNQPIAMALLIDTSGSVKDTDPERLREDAANIFIELLGPEDYLSIITFNSDVDFVIPMAELKDDERRKSYKELLSSELDPRGNTDYTLAFEKAHEELIKVVDKDVRKVIVFLTDGSPHPDEIGSDEKLMEEYMSDFWATTVSKLRENETAVYSIGFSEGIDIAVLDKLALETGGQARIYKDMQDLDENLIQVLKTRETIESELLNPVVQKSKDLTPKINTDFWADEEGYRIGEEIPISASLNLENNRLNVSEEFQVDEFEVVLDYGSQEKIVLALYDDGDPEHLDIASGDGLWTNKLNFTKKGEADLTIVSSGLYKDEPFTSEKSLGQVIIAEAGSIIVSTVKEDMWQRVDKELKLSIKIENSSEFTETVILQIDEEIGRLSLSKLELEANSSKKIDLGVKLNENLSRGFHSFKLNLKPLDKLTTINREEVEFNLEIVSSLENLKRIVINNNQLFIILLVVFIGIPLLIYLLGVFLFLILVKPKLKVKGMLTYSEEGNLDAERKINLKKMKKKLVKISFDKNKEADYHIEGSEYSYDLILKTQNISEKKSFIQGWTTLFKGTSSVVTLVECSQPGILVYKDGLTTDIVLSNEEVFSSGGYAFHYSRPKLKLLREQSSGKNILEGRV